RRPADRLGVVEEDRVVRGRVEPAAAVEVGERPLLALREVLRAEEPALLEHDDVPAALGQVHGQRRPAGAGPDHDDVGAILDVARPVRPLDDHTTSPKSTGYAGISIRSRQGPVKPVIGRVASSQYAKK